jgi:RNA polymerase sigma-70 factor, ECF subfamily
MKTANYPTFTTQICTEHSENDSDEALIQTFCSSKSEWVLEQLYTRYRRYMYALAYSIIGDSYLAEDVVQDAFLTLWRKASTYHEQEGSVKSWLQAIVRNRAIDKVRSLAQRERQCIPLEDMNELNSSHLAPEVWEQVWEADQATVIRNALAQLPTEQSLAIELNYFYGYTHVEIAKQQQIPLGTVKGRVRLGLQKIKLLLQDYNLNVSL